MESRLSSVESSVYFRACIAVSGNNSSVLLVSNRTTCALLMRSKFSVDVRIPVTTSVVVMREGVVVGAERPNPTKHRPLNSKVTIVGAMTKVTIALNMNKDGGGLARRFDFKKARRQSVLTTASGLGVGDDRRLSRRLNRC